MTYVYFIKKWNQKMDQKCQFCEKTAALEIGVCKYNSTRFQSVGLTCFSCSAKAVSNLLDQCFATEFWPAVKKEKKLIFHGYRDAEAKKLSVEGEWKNLLNSFRN